jgi:hypothetical protein
MGIWIFLFERPNAFLKIVNAFLVWRPNQKIVGLLSFGPEAELKFVVPNANFNHICNKKEQNRGWP